MQRLVGRAGSAWLLLLCMVCSSLAGTASAAEPPVRFRDLAYRLEDLGKLVGRPVNSVLALEYKIVLLVDGQEESVDPKTHRFNLGDKIRLAIEPFSDAHVYIFHVGASGRTSFLLPREENQPPRVNAHKMISLPSTGYFEFIEPPGDEKLLVVAMEEPVADRALLAAVLTKDPKDFTAEETALRKTIIDTVEEHLKSVQDREVEKRDGIVKFRGITSGPQWDKLVRDVKTRSPGAGSIEEPPTNSDDGTFVLCFSMTDDDKPGSRPRLLVHIPLKSRGGAASKR